MHIRRIVRHRAKLQHSKMHIQVHSPEGTHKATMLIVQVPRTDHCDSSPANRKSSESYDSNFEFQTHCQLALLPVLSRENPKKETKVWLLKEPAKQVCPFLESSSEEGEDNQVTLTFTFIVV